LWTKEQVDEWVKDLEGKTWDFVEPITMNNIRHY
jgi:hypothetical protein